VCYLFDKVQVTSESNNEVVYTLRIKGNSFSPKVFVEGKYTIKIGVPQTERVIGHAIDAGANYHSLCITGLMLKKSKNIMLPIPK